MRCLLTDISAVWTLEDSKTPIGSNGQPEGTVTPTATGYYCENCGHGFADFAGCLSHIVYRDIAEKEVSAALQEAVAVGEPIEEVASEETVTPDIETTEGNVIP